MKIEIDQLPIELCKKMLDVVSRLPKNVQLFLARNEDIILKSFEKLKDFEPVTFPDLPPYILSDVKETTRGILWRKRLMDRFSGDQFMEKICKGKQNAQPKCLVKPCNINVTLYPKELFQELGLESINDLSGKAFTYSQIVSILSKHKDEKKQKQGVLLYEGTSHFPLILANGEVEIVSFQSRKPWRVHTRWQGWFNGDSCIFKGRLLLKESV